MLWVTCSSELRFTQTGGDFRRTKQLTLGVCFLAMGVFLRIIPNENDGFLFCWVGETL